MTTGDKAIGVAAWIIAVMLVIYHGFLAYWHFMPTEHWLVYYGVTPIKAEFLVDEPLKFRSQTTLHKNVILTFNDILYCRDEVGDFNRYSSQDTKRLHSVIGEDRYTVWPYSPGVAYPTECCLESNINLHLPTVDRHLRYDGCVNQKYFKIVSGDDNDTGSDNEVYQSGGRSLNIGGDNIKP